MNILIIPDSHSSPDTSNERFVWLGRFILDRQPDIIVNLGDLFDMNSLCSYDRSKKSFEGRRYKKDLKAGHDALAKMHSPFNEYNEQRRSSKRAKLKEPRKVITLGNHENRITRAVESSPELEGLMSLENLKLKSFGYEIYDFKKPVCVEGIWFSHYFPSGVKGEAISGFNIASNLLQKNMASSICGHSHLWDMAIRAKPDGSKVMALNAGWYGEQPTFTDATEQLWWSGITWLHNVHNGVFDVEQISIERIKSQYA